MEWLKKLRADKGYSQKETAKLCFLSQPSYANIENDKRHPSVSTAKRIADVLNFDWTRFYETEKTSA